MHPDATPALAVLACLLLAGCLGGSPLGPAAPSIEEEPLPDRPATLTNSSVLEYAVAYEATTLHNRIAREYDVSSIAAVETCEFPAKDPRDGALDYWIERRAGDEFYLVLRCPVDIDNRGAEQSGSGTIGEWTTYAVTPEATSRVELGNDVVRVTNRTVNFDDEPHAVTLTVTGAGGDGSVAEPAVEQTYDLDAGSHLTIRAIAPANGTYEVHVRVDGGPGTTYRTTASAGENLFERTGVYVSPDGDVVVDRHTETYLDG